jgi:thiaminase/transcriptional activator TenA
MSVQEKVGLVQHLREGDQPLWGQMVGHPFLVEVEEDRLPDEKLLFYFIQNANYIDAAIAASAEAAASAPTPESRKFCVDLIEFGSEQLQIQRGYVGQLAKGKDVDWEMAPACHAYTSHLLKTAAYGGTLDYLVALMPCSWSYDEFAQRIGPVVKHPITKDWLANFGGDEHNNLTVDYHAVVNQLAEGLTPQRLAYYEELFHTGCRYEHMFWDMSYNMTGWPV